MLPVERHPPCVCNAVKERFFDLAESLRRETHAGETLLLNLSSERSDFVRFNRARVRQAGTVEQCYVSVRLISARRQASATIAICGDAADLENARATLEWLRGMLSQLPEDPWVLISEEPASTAHERRGTLPAAEELTEYVAAAAGKHDFAGFYAAGSVYRGFASSLGHQHWHEVDTFNFDWSVYLAPDKAVKEGYAGFDWDASVFDEKLQTSLERLGFMATAARALDPAEYRVYLAPRAVEEITGLLSYSAFSARAQATRQSALLRMQNGEAMSPRVSLIENTHGGVSAAFQEDGFVKPGQIELIVNGRLTGSLVSARSAREYGLAANGANSRETPESIDLSGGTLESADVLAALDTGLFVSNLWYLNYSDKAAGRITGMTRFATFRVENGRIAGPVAPLRFDDTVFRILGEELVDLTSARELLLSTSTYDERSTASSRLPGLLLSGLRFTL